MIAYRSHTRDVPRQSRGPAAGFFLAYQQRWLDDTSRLKICKKSRRIGWTFIQAYEDVRDAARAEGGMDVWFSSTDLGAAQEYIRYCELWAKVYKAAARDLGEIVIRDDDEKSIKARVIEFESGRRINALSSNPKGFRSKGGKVVIDEFAFHDEADELWRAAAPSITWGYPMRVFSSSNGTGTKFYELCEQAKRDDSKWSYHEVTLYDAVVDGLVEKVRKLDRPATEAEIAEFIAETREIAGDEETFEQEYLCVDQDSSKSFIENHLIFACEHPHCPQPITVDGKALERIDSDSYPADEWAFDFEPGAEYLLGVDVGRVKDLTVMWLLEKLGDIYWTRFVLALKRMQLRKQYRHLERFLPHVRRACIDQSGLGRQLAEDALEAFGSYRVEPITFTNQAKEAIAGTLRPEFEDVRLRIPRNQQIRQEIRKVKKQQLPGGARRYAGERDEHGHADFFWALGLARYAADRVRGPIEAKVVQKRRFSSWKGAW